MLKQLFGLAVLPITFAAMQPAMVLPNNPFVLPYADSRRSPSTNHPPVIQNLQDNVCVPLQDAAKSGDRGSFFYVSTYLLVDMIMIEIMAGGRVKICGCLS